MELKENEKEKSLAEYNQAVNDFEAVAQKLYASLKQKETLEEYTIEKLTQGISVQEIRHNQQFVTNLELTVAHYQKLVQLTRNRMTEKQAKLLQHNIEVKKYEKLKEKHFNTYLEQNKQTENKNMDDLSTQVFLYKGNR